MIVAIIFLLIISITASVKKPYVSICLILLLLPHQFILKKIFDNQFGSGDLFSVWKEVLVVILFFKTYKKKQGSFTKIQILTTLFITLSILFYIVTDNHITSLANLRNYTFPVFLFIVIAVHKFDIESKWVIRSIVLSSFVAIILGLIQQYFLSIPFSMYKGTIDFIDETGYIQYINTSFRIMGIERMSGGFSGPNDFGVYMSLMVVFLSVLLFSANRSSFSKIFNSLIILSFTGSVVCLILSFSRAGWFIAFSSLSIIFLVQIKNKIKNIFILFITMLIVSVIAIPLAPDTVIKAGEILTESVSMKEASAADRGNQFWKGVEKTITEPLGHGVGTSDLRYKESLGFFVESGWWNIGYELGIPGLFLFLQINLQILFRIYRLRKRSRSYKVIYPFDSYAIALMISTLITGFFSINVVGTTYIYYYWIFIGLSFKTFIDSNILSYYVDTMKSDEPVIPKVYNFNESVQL